MTSAVIFDQRKDIMRSENVHDTVDMHEAVVLIVERAIPANSYHDQWLVEQWHDTQRFGYR